MELADIKGLIEKGKVEYVKIGASDIEGVYRGKRVAARHFLNSLEDGFAQCDVLFGWTSEKSCCLTSNSATGNAALPTSS
jgi:glutamine synthetase